MFRTNNYNYDWDWMASFEGDMGPYLQYADVRLTHKNPGAAPRAGADRGVVMFVFCLELAISNAWETVVVKGEADVERPRPRMWLCNCMRGTCLGLGCGC
jgi:arginyl-tRNA synthetase